MKRIVLIDNSRRYRLKSLIKVLYNVLPKVVQTIINSIYGIFKKIESDNIYNFKLIEYDNEEKLSIIEIEQQQLNKLRAILLHADKHTKYYNELFIKLKFNPDTLTSIKELKKVPIMDKSTFIDNYNNLISDNYNDFNPIKKSSGGTTGTSLDFLMDSETCSKNESQVIHYWKRHGFKIGKSRTIMYRADVLIPQGQKIIKPWRIDYGKKTIHLSSYYASELLYKKYYKLLKQWQPKYMHFLPSAAYLFAKYMNENGFTIKLNKAFSASEMLHDFQKIEIEKAFDCKVVDHYGHSEPGIYVSGQCIEGHYHIYTNDVIAEVTEDGSLLETSLHNKSMPFIRYKVGDLVDGIHHGCNCGISTPFFKKIYGRESSIIYTADGRVTSSIGFDQIFRGNNIRLGQIVQNKKGALILNLVIEKKFTKVDEINVLSKLHERVGIDTKVEIKYLEDIPKAKSGKYNLVISNV